MKLPQPDGVNGIPVSNRGDDKERYRWFFLKKNNREKDNFAPIIAYNKKFSQSGSAFERDLENVIDVDSWLRGMAYAVLSGAGDNAGAGSQHNGMYYARPDGRVIFFPHDMDFAFDPNRSLFANSECAKLTQDPRRLRIYLGHIRDIIRTTYNVAYMRNWTTHLASFDSRQNWTGHLNFVQRRFSFVRTELNRLIRPVTFSVIGSNPLRVSSSTAMIRGKGWVDVRQIRLVGAEDPLEVEWTDATTWQAEIPVAIGSHDYTVESIDFSGDVIAQRTITIENTGSVEPASATNLAISELMYHPADPTAEEIALGFDDDDFFEFVEVMNIGDRPIDLNGVAFTEGIEFAFPDLTLAPGRRLVVAAWRPAYLRRYPNSADLLSMSYGREDGSNRFSNGGEEVVLSDALGNDIVRFRYDDGGEWPAAADGGGYSLVSIAPGPEENLDVPVNWRSSSLPGGNPGTSDAATPFVGDPNEDADDDGWDALLEHALGTSDASPNNGDLITIGLASIESNDYLTFSFTRNIGADDVVLLPQLSHDLVNWVSMGAVLLSAKPDGLGGEVRTYRCPNPVDIGSQSFIRLSVQRR